MRRVVAVVVKAQSLLWRREIETVDIKMGLRLSDYFFDKACVLLNPIYTWAPIPRRAYLLSLPFSFFARALFIAAFFGIGVIFALILVVIYYFVSVWNGKDPQW